MVVNIEPSVLKRLEKVFETFYLSGSTTQSGDSKVVTVKVSIRATLKDDGKEISLNKEIPFSDEKIVNENFST